MTKKCALDMTGFFVCLALLLTVVLYPERIRGWDCLMWASGILGGLFLLMAFVDRAGAAQPGKGRKRDVPAGREAAAELVLLNEEDQEAGRWDLYGKTAVVIGRDVKENQVDIDLSASPYASMVEIEHAVLNFSAGSWYVEDLGSRNGISVKKAEDGRVYRLSADTPCRIVRGDILHVGLSRLQLR